MKFCTGFFMCILWLFAEGVAAANAYDVAIPVPLAKVLLDVANDKGNVEIYTDIPDEFPPFELPPDLRVYGSSEQDPIQTVVLQTALGSELAAELMVEALQGEDWTVLEQSSSPQPEVGFVANPLTVIPVTINLCHEVEGVMHLSAYEVEGMNLMTLTRENPQLAPGIPPLCADLVAQYDSQASDKFFDSHLPLLIVPGPSLRRIPGGRSGGSFGAVQELEISTDIASDWPIEDVYTHFARQIAEQDWVLDVNWLGLTSAGGSWNKTAQDDMHLGGTLTIFERDSDKFEILFRMFTKAIPAP